MTEALFLETSLHEEKLKEEGKHRLNVSGVLNILGVSRSGYLAWKKRLPSNREIRKKLVKERILTIYNESHQNYGAPKVAECLRREGEKIADKTVGNYMRELGIKAQYVMKYSQVSRHNFKQFFIGDRKLLLSPISRFLLIGRTSIILILIRTRNSICSHMNIIINIMMLGYQTENQKGR